MKKKHKTELIRKISDIKTHNKIQKVLRFKENDGEKSSFKNGVLLQETIVTYFHGNIAPTALYVRYDVKIYMTSCYS